MNASIMAGTATTLGSQINEGPANPHSTHMYTTGEAVKVLFEYVKDRAPDNLLTWLAQADSYAVCQLSELGDTCDKLGGLYADNDTDDVYRCTSTLFFTLRTALRDLEATLKVAEDARAITRQRLELAHNLGLNS